MKLKSILKKGKSNKIGRNIKRKKVWWIDNNVHSSIHGPGGAKRGDVHPGREGSILRFSRIGPRRDLF